MDIQSLLIIAAGIAVLVGFIWFLDYVCSFFRKRIITSSQSSGRAFWIGDIASPEQARGIINRASRDFTILGIILLPLTIPAPASAVCPIAQICAAYYLKKNSRAAAYVLLFLMALNVLSCALIAIAADTRAEVIIAAFGGLWMSAAFWMARRALQAIRLLRKPPVSA